MVHRLTAPCADLRAAFGWAPAARVVGMVGVLGRWKGQEVFLAKRWASWAARRRDLRFVVVGIELYTTRGHGDFERPPARL